MGTVSSVARWLVRKPGLLHAACAAVVLASAASAQTAGSTAVIHFADAGQGDATIIRTPEGKTILIDAGRSAAAMQRLFFEFTDDTLDLVIASHNHADHIGGMPWVLERFVVRAYMENGIPANTGIYSRTMAAVAREPGILYLEATPRTVTVGSLSLRVLPPARVDASQNDNSVGVLISHGLFRALFTGDSEARQLDAWLRAGLVDSVHVLKAAHHGSRNGVTDAWLQATRPKVVIVSVGRNGYGHPSPEVLRAWQSIGATVYRTDEHRGVFISARSDGSFDVIRPLSAPLVREP